MPDGPPELQFFAIDAGFRVVLKDDHAIARLKRCPTTALWLLSLEATPEHVVDVTRIINVPYALLDVVARLEAAQTPRARLDALFTADTGAET